jgi:hypothetical protein
MENSFNVKKIMPIALGVVVFVLAFFATRHFLSSPSGEATEEVVVSTEEALMNAANEMNDRCPVMMGDDTRLENVSYTPDQVLQLSHTMINLRLAEIQGDVESMKETTRESRLQSVKEDDELAIFRENGVDISFYYNDSDGNWMFDFTITPDVYE